jgi:hypothetical protein
LTTVPISQVELEPPAPHRTTNLEGVEHATTFRKSRTASAARSTARRMTTYSLDPAGKSMASQLKLISVVLVASRLDFIREWTSALTEMLKGSSASKF